MHLHSFHNVCEKITSYSLTYSILTIILCHDHITAKKIEGQECEVTYTKSHTYYSRNELRCNSRHLTTKSSRHLLALFTHWTHVS